MYGLVLEGGGARGAYHIGAYKALLEEGIEIGGISGTSVGALNGAMIAQGDFERAYEIWSDMSYSRVMDASIEEIFKLGKKGKLDKEEILLLAGKLKGVISDGGLDIRPLKDLIAELVDEDRIRRSGKDFGLVTVSLTDMKPLEVYIEDVPMGKLEEYLMASAYLPIFKREKIGGKRYIDGSLYNNLPANLLIDKGYRNLILIRTHALGVIRKMKLDGLNTLVISPKEDLGKVLDFDGDSARHNLQLGYFDALKALRGLKGYSYYIDTDKDEDYFMDHLLGLDEARLSKLLEIFRIDGLPNRRNLFEKIIPKISHLLGLDKDGDYGDVFYILLERLAKLYRIENFMIYSYDQLLGMVEERLRSEGNREGEGIRVIERIIEKVELSHIFDKEGTIVEIGKVLLL